MSNREQLPFNSELVGPFHAVLAYLSGLERADDEFTDLRDHELDAFPDRRASLEATMARFVGVVEPLGDRTTMPEVEAAPLRAILMLGNTLTTGMHVSGTRYAQIAHGLYAEFPWGSYHTLIDSLPKNRRVLHRTVYTLVGDLFLELRRKIESGEFVDFETEEQYAHHLRDALVARGEEACQHLEQGHLMSQAPTFEEIQAGLMQALDEAFGYQDDGEDQVLNVKYQA